MNTSSKNIEGTGIFDTAKALLFGRTKLPPKVRKIVKTYGNDEIDYIQIARNPLTKGVTMALNAVSFGDFARQAKKLPYDRLFHLYMIITLKSGKNILLEKNEVIMMEVGAGVRKDAESKLVRVNKNLTIETLLSTTKTYMGNNFLPYSASTNNCQDFLLAVLKSNKLGNENVYKFIKQKTDEIFKKNRFLAKVSNFVTDFGSKVNILKEGASYSSKKKGRKSSRRKSIV